MRRWLMVLIVAVAFATLAFGPMSVKCGVLEDVKDYVEAFSNIIVPAGSVGEQLKMISLSMSRLVQLAGPVGTFAALAMQKAFEPESEELQALNFLHVTMIKQFNGLDQRIEHLGNKLIEHMALVEYDQMITHPLDIILRVYKKITDPSRNRTLYRKQFVHFCTYHLSPHNSLLWLNKRVNLNCVNPTQEEADTFAKASKIFDIIDKNSTNFVHLTQRRYADFRRKIIHQLSLAKNISLLDSVKNKIYGPSFALESAIVDLHHSLKIGLYQRNHGRCILKEISDANENIREELYELILMIELDSLKLISVGSLCANVSHNGDKKGTLDELSDLKAFGINITTGMRIYSDQKLETAWPTLMTYYAQKSNEELQKPGNDTNTSRAIKFALDKRGPYNIFHNVVLSPTWTGPNWYYPECEPFLCINVQNESMPFNLLISRYEHMQQERAYRAYRYVYGNANKIQETMRNECYEQVLPLPDCLERMKKKLPALRSYATYRTILFLHTRGLRKIDATIPTAITSFTTSGSSQTTQLVQTFHNPSILSLAHCFKLFFLL
ncbi:hypothetical protein niasHS_015678 [Heterodera schachtii]|uniref:Uncharacterized protein n=1 Tax=Heterodera schachtii TaxID=97005 RepID=A0ABD2HYP0_HETSC